MKRLSLVVAMMMCAVLWLACQSRAEQVLEAMSALNALAEVQGQHCEEMGKALDAYLSQHEPIFREALSKAGDGDVEWAKAFYESSAALEAKTRHCQSAEMQAFRQRFAALALAGVQAP